MNLHLRATLSGPCRNRDSRGDEASTIASCRIAAGSGGRQKTGGPGRRCHSAAAWVADGLVV